MKQIRLTGIVIMTFNIIIFIMMLIKLRNRLLLSFVLAAIILESILMIICELKIFYPLYKLNRKVNSGDNEEDIKELMDKEIYQNPFLRREGFLMDNYTSFRVRQNNAEIFNKQTELTALQSQINPHFLYNTLDTIRGQAMISEDNEVAGMIEALAAFFRYSISRKGNMVTLRDELSNIKNYMKIQQYRFNDRFSMDIIVDEEDKRAYDFFVPRLILQPIVENAIVHGLKEKPHDARISIEVNIADDLIITVSDNGKGMALRELDSLNERIHSPRMRLEEEKEFREHGTGIALPNINKRIELLYGKRYGLNLYSSEGCGTDVEIMIPIINHIEENEIEENSVES